MPQEHKKEIYGAHSSYTKDLGIPESIPLPKRKDWRRIGGDAQCRVDGDQGSLSFNFKSTLVLESSILGKGVRMLDTSGLDFVSPFAGSMGDLLMAVEEDREQLVSGRRNLSTIRTILAEDESAGSGCEWVLCSELWNADDADSADVRG